MISTDALKQRMNKSKTMQNTKSTCVIIYIYMMLILIFTGIEGIEPSHNRIKNDRLTAWLYSINSIYVYCKYYKKIGKLHKIQINIVYDSRAMSCYGRLI